MGLRKVIRVRLKCTMETYSEAEVHYGHIQWGWSALWTHTVRLKCTMEI